MLADLHDESSPPLPSPATAGFPMHTSLGPTLFVFSSVSLEGEVEAEAEEEREVEEEWKEELGGEDKESLSLCRIRNDDSARNKGNGCSTMNTLYSVPGGVSKWGIPAAKPFTCLCDCLF